MVTTTSVAPMISSVCKTRKGDSDVPKGEGTFSAGAF
jgi:hypothetical protein